jgi:HK97 family phage portal protein
VIADNFPEPRLEVAVRKDDGTTEAVADQELARLVDRPNPYYDGYTLWDATSLSLECDGNAYWFKVRSPAFKVVELWYVPHFLLEPLYPADGSAFVAAWLYTVNGRRYVIHKDDVVHLRTGIDPRDDRKGLSRLKQAAREVASDNGAATFTAALVKNAGVPAVIIVPTEPGASFGEGEADQIKDDWREHHSGDGVGTPLVTSSVKVERLGFSPKELALGDLPDRFEDRIAGLSGVPAMLAGLSSGASHKTYSNYAEARRALYEDKLIPLQKRVALALTQQLLEADFAAPPGAFVRWDYQGIPCLRENLNEIAERVGKLYAEWQVIKRKQALDALEYPSGPEDEVYFSEASAPPAPPAPPPPALPATPEDDEPPAVKDAWRRLEALGERTSVKALGDKPAGDVPDANEDNTFGLPDGRPL